MVETDSLVSNARNGCGRCDGCPAHRSGRSKYVNPGFFNPDANVVFVTIEPSHRFNWDDYENWEAYNATLSQRFRDAWTGGQRLERLLEPFSFDLEDTWMTDAIKCPPPRGDDDKNRPEEFGHCRGYLSDELVSTDRSAVITLGNRAANRTLRALGKSPGIVKTSHECGRRYPTDPPIIVSPHWSNGWLGRTTTERWGDGWLDDYPELKKQTGKPYRQIVQASLAHVLNC
jgi:uracil-DNA glycosylase